MAGDLSFQLGRFLVILGVILVAAGLLLMGGFRLPALGLGKLPGDITYKGKSGTLYFPVVSCLIFSVALSFIVWLISFLMKR